MKTFMLGTSQRQGSIVAGIAIVAMTIAAGIANDVTIGSLITENNASETLMSITASNTTINVGVFCWLIILISDVFAAWGLNLFFKPVNQNLSLLAAWFRLVYAAMLAASIFNLVYVQLLIHQPNLAAVVPSNQLGENVMFYLGAFDAMFSVSLIVFSIHILLLGYLSLKSEYLPKIFGIILIVAFAGYALINISNLVFPEFKEVMRIVEIIFLIPMLGEVALGIWLLVLGLRTKNNTKHRDNDQETPNNFKNL